MFGSLPAALTYYWRLKMPETARYTALVAKDAKRAASDMSKVLQVEIEEEQSTVEQIARRTPLASSRRSSSAATASTCSAPPPPGSSSTSPSTARTYPHCPLRHGARYWFTVALIDVIGRFTIQVLGFFMMTAFMLVLAIPYHHWTTKGNHIGFIVMYPFTFFFANFGPNSTTFIIPAEIFAARLRSTCHGISAASGKLGAIVGSLGFLYLAQNQDPVKVDRGYRAGIGVRNSLFLLAGCSLLGLACSFLVPESKGKSLEEMSGENKGEEQVAVGSNRTVPVYVRHLDVEIEELQMNGQCGRLGLNLTVRHRSGEHVRGLALRCAGPPRRTSPSGINGVDPSSWWQTLASDGYRAPSSF
ncbi:hypothetical protein B296_00005881 [Ensete ventricosum]|uniref:H(+)/Pi cotransporter n=1 Tax=Ensete ventricosum TaxID=4639 RepID=A0A427AUX3_ENSVE|nr:hypothetical protein B296_00005881 [Ensete ventricosum]